MKVTQLNIVRYLLIVTCSLIGVTLLAIGANAALDLRTSEAAKMVSTQETASAIQLALIIGNGNYPDAAEPLDQPINDASGLGGVDSRDFLLGANQIQGCFWGGSLGCDGAVGFERRGVGADGAADYRPA